MEKKFSVKSLFFESRSTIWGFFSNSFLYFSILPEFDQKGISDGATQCIQLCKRKPQRNNSRREIGLLSQQLKICSKKSTVRFHSEKHRRTRIQTFLRGPKQYLAGAMQTWVHQERLGKAQELSYQNWCHRDV